MCGGTFCYSLIQRYDHHVPVPHTSLLFQTQNGSSSKLTPIPVLHESSSKKDSASTSSGDLSKKLEQQEIMFNAEKVSLTELYEGRIKNTQETVSKCTKEWLIL